MKARTLIKRLLSLMIVVVFCLGLTPGTAWAATATTVQVGGVELNSTTVYAVTDNGTVTTEGASSSNWNIKFENGTLTLKGANIADSYVDGEGKAYGIYADGDLELVLGDTSTVQNADTAFNYGVYINGSLTVSGTGSLTADGKSYGIYVANAMKMTANSGSVTGNNTGTSNDDYGDGIYVGNTLTVDGGTVTGSGKSKTSKLNGAGIHVYAGGLTVTAGSVTGTATGERSEGIYVKQGNLAVSGSGSVVTGNGSGQWCQGIRLEKGNLEVSSGSVEGTATDANSQGYGIYMYYNCDLKVTGGSVTGTGCGQSGYGIIVNNEITVEDGTVSGTCSDLYGTGIGAAQGLTVSGSGSVTGSGQSGYGIRAYNGDIRITGTDTYVKGTSQIPEYAIYVGAKYALYVNEVRYEPSSVTEFEVENGQVTGAIEWTGSGNVWVNGVKITGDPNYTVTCGSGKAVYNPNTGTLTLTNAAIDASYEDVDGTYGIYAEGDLILVLEGSSTVKSSDKAFDCSVCIGGDLTVKGGGTLTVNGSGCGIYASNMTVESGSVTGTSTGSNSYGIGVRNVLTVQGGSVTGTSTGSGSYGIDVFKDALTVSGGTVTGTGKKAGIYLEKNALKVSGGTVTGEGTNYGIYVPMATLTVSGSGSVSGTASGSEGDGIYTKYSLTVNGGTVTGTATGQYGWGINVDASSLTVEGGSVTGTGNSTGIYANSGLTVKAGSVTGTGTGEDSWGIDAAPLNVTGGIVTGKGTNAAIVAYSQGNLAAGNLISVPANYVPSGYGAQAVVVQNSGNTFTYASFAETGKELAYDKDSGFTNAATAITLKAPGAVSFPRQFYGSINFDPSYGYKSFGHVTQSGDSLTYTETGDVTGRTIYGMESAGGAIFTVESDNDSEWMLRVYSSDLATFRTIGRVTNQAGTMNYAIVDTAMDLSGTEPVLYGTYQALGVVGGQPAYCSYICQIDLTSGITSDYLQVTGLSSTNDIVYAIAFGKDGKLYAIGADMGDDGGPATLYTIDLDTGAATKVGEIKDSSGNAISTNYTQDLAYDYNTGTLYWMENAKEVLYTVDAASAVATRVGQVKHSDPPYYLPQAYSVSAFCILDGTPATSGKRMVSVIYDTAGETTVTKQGESTPAAAVYMLDDNASLTLKITPDPKLGLWYVKVDGKEIDITDSTQSITQTIQINGKDHVIEVASRLPNPVTRVDTWQWLHYQGKTAKYYTQEITNKFYDWDRFNPDSDTPDTGYTQTLLDENNNAIDNDTVILPGLYGVRVTHPGTEKYAPLTLEYNDALDLAKCNGTPGRPVVYGKVGCKQSDLATTSALQDYYGSDGELIDAAHDEIPVTLVWQEPETIYDKAGNFNANATIHAANQLSEHILACYNLDDGTPLTEGCQISSRNTQVIVLPADQASIIRLQTSDAAGGTVSGKGVYKNDDQVTVTATPNTNAGYVFWGWQDESGQIISGADATYTFTAENDRTLTAVFVKDPEYLVILTTEGEDGCGTVTGGGNYKEGEHSATVSATVSKGYYFIGWYAGEERKSTETSYTFAVPEEGIALTAKFGIDYLTRAEQAKENFASALDNKTLKWATIKNAVDAYKAAESFIADPPSVIEEAKNRYDALTTYYNDVKALSLSGQNLGNDDLATLTFFTGVTELNLSDNAAISNLNALSKLSLLETLDISGTGVKTTESLSLKTIKTLTAKNLTLTSISSLAKLVNEDSFDASSVNQWDFTDSTLPDTEENKADIEAIKEALDDKFLPPNIMTTPTPPSGGGGGGAATSHAVSVSASEHGGVSVSPESAAAGTVVTVTATPDEGFEVRSLTVTGEGGEAIEAVENEDGTWSFEMPEGDVTVEAVFGCDGGELCPSHGFADVDHGKWYHDAIDWVVKAGLMGGFGDGSFHPDDVLTRAQVAQILWCAEGRPEAPEAPFPDVSEGDWYFSAASWAADAGVFGGYGGTGAFGPNDPLTREQAAAVLMRWAGLKGMDTSGRADLSSYPDADSVSGWADECMSWAVADGVIGGVGQSDGSLLLDARGTSSRAVAAALMMNLLG